MLTTGPSTGNNMMTALIAAADAGSGFASIVIYGGTVPTNAASALSGNTLLVQVTCPKPCATVASKRAIFASLPQDIAVTATGTPTFFRLLDSDANVILQGTAGLNTTNNLQLSKTVVEVGGTVSIVYVAIAIP